MNAKQYREQRDEAWRKQWKAHDALKDVRTMLNGAAVKLYVHDQLMIRIAQGLGEIPLNNVGDPVNG